MANDNSKTPTTAQPQMIPLSKIHELPGIFNPKPQDKSLGSMVISIESNGVKEAVILRQRDDGEYQLLSGYRRRRASELAKKQDIPAHVYEMTMQEAIAYRKAVKQNPNAPIPGKLIDPGPDKDKADQPAAPGEDKTAEAAHAAPDKGDKDKEGEAHAAPTGKDAPADKGKGKDGQPAAPAEGNAPEAAPAVPDKGDKAKEGEAHAAPTGKDGPADKDKDKDKDGQPAAPGEGKTAEAAPAAPDKGDKAKEGEAHAAPTGKDGPADKGKDTQPTAPGENKTAEAAPAAPDKGDKAKESEAHGAPTGKDSPADKDKGKDTQPAAPGEGKTAEAAPAEDKAKRPAPTPSVDKSGEALTAASEGPAGTSITQIFEKRLAPPDEASMKNLPTPGEGESYFITLHPAYLEKSVFNNFSVDTESENFKELLKSVELVGIKDPVLARFNQEGKLEILSGQRRHVAATMLNQAVPTIIQKIDDADAKIIVADGNLHRDKISSYDLSRALRMKMEGMKQKAGRRKKGYTANELQSDAKLAQEMGMTVSKLNRYIRMSEAIKGVCELVDDGRLTVSVASEISALKPKTQESVLHLLDLGYKATNERISRMKKAEGAGKKLDEMTLRSILDDKDIAPAKQPEPVKQAEPVKQPETTAAPSTGTAPAATGEAPIPASPDVPAPAPTAPGQTAGATPAAPQETGPAQGDAAPASTEPPKEDDPFKGPQERPEVTKVILAGDRLRRYFPDVTMTPREIEESIYSALEERRQRQMKEQQKTAIFKRNGPSH